MPQNMLGAYGDWAAGIADDPLPNCRQCPGDNSMDAKSAVHDGTVYDFCSNNCRETFEASPQAYTAPAMVQEPKPMEHAHE